MKYILLIPCFLFFSHKTTACDFLDKSNINKATTFMGKKSQFYDVYKQSKCVLEKVLSTLPVEQKEVIANLIAKTYKTVN